MPVISWVSAIQGCPLSGVPLYLDLSSSKDSLIVHINNTSLLQELPEVSDLTYLERGRLEEEYRKLKELKKKAEYYAVEAKQTAQRLSAENFKLKEDLSRERHHNELTRKNMIREMEQKMDKSATALDRADARLEVFEQEVTARALQLIRRMPAPAMASRLSRGGQHITTMQATTIVIFANPIVAILIEYYNNWSMHVGAAHSKIG